MLEGRLGTLQILGPNQFNLKMKVLAGICMTREPISDDSEEKPTVISIGTGTKTITGENFTASGHFLYK